MTCPHCVRGQVVLEGGAVVPCWHCAAAPTPPDALREAVQEAIAELENDPKTRTCYNVAAALRRALAPSPPTRG